MKEDIITVIGSLNYDIIVKQDRLPLKGETYIGESITFSGGGKGANQAVQSAKLGARTYMVGKVGQDSFGDFLIHELKSYNVNIDHLERSESTTGIGIVHALNDGSVYATITAGANGDVDRAQIDRALPLIAKSKIMILQMEVPMDSIEYAIEIGKQQNCVVVLNAAPAAPISDHALEQVDYLIVNEPEASYYCEAQIKDYDSALMHYKNIYKRFKGVLIITLGSQGSFLYDLKDTHHIPTKDVPVIETTGAGDSYIGAFSVALLNHQSIQEACNFGTKVAEITVTRVGAQNSMPYASELPALKK